MSVITTPPPGDFGWSARFIDEIGSSTIDLEIEIWPHGAFGPGWRPWDEWLHQFVEGESVVAVEISALTRGTLRGHAGLVGTSAGAIVQFQALVFDKAEPYLPNLYRTAG